MVYNRLERKMRKKDFFNSNKSVNICTVITEKMR